MHTHVAMNITKPRNKKNEGSGPSLKKTGSSLVLIKGQNNQE